MGISARNVLPSIASVSMLACCALASAGTVDSLTLTGETVYPAMPGALIDVVGGVSPVQTTADATGRYSATIECGDPDDLVAVYAQGVGDQSHLRLARLTHSCGELQSLGKSGSLALGPLSPISSGVYAVAHWFVNDHIKQEWPVNLATLGPHIYTLQLNAVDLAQFAMGYIVAGMASLPPGVENTLAMLLDRHALLAVIHEVESGLTLEQILEIRSAALNPMIWDPRLYRRPGQPSVPQYMITGCPALRDACYWYAKLAPDGTAQYVTDYSMLTEVDSGQWIDRGMIDEIFHTSFVIKADNLHAIRITGEDGEPLRSWSIYPYIPELGHTVEAVREHAWRDMRIASVSELIPLVGTTDRHVTRYPDYPELQPEISQQTLPAWQTSLTEFSNLPPWAAPQIGETWALPIRLDASPVDSTFYPVDKISFSSSGNAEAVYHQLDLSWSVDGGELVLTGEDINEHRYRYLGGLPGRHAQLYIEVWEGEGILDSNWLSGFQVTSEQGFKEANVPGRYVSGWNLDLAVNPLFVQFDYYFAFDLEPGGVGHSGYMFGIESPLETDIREVTWEIDADGRLVIVQIYEPEQFEAARRWEILGNDMENGDVYMLETPPEFGTPGNVPSFDSHRIQFYRRLPLPH